jgi:hypothetical protein
MESIGNEALKLKFAHTVIENIFSRPTLDAHKTHSGATDIGKRRARMN